MSLRERLKTRTTGREHVTSARSISGKSDLLVWNVKCPAQSPDLSPLDLLLWGYLKKSQPQTSTELEGAIVKEIKCIESEVMKAVIDSIGKGS